MTAQNRTPASVVKLPSPPAQPLPSSLSVVIKQSGALVTTR